MLKKRLKIIAEQVPLNARVADIGTDHGFIPVYLIRNGLASRVIASDISFHSLEKAKALISNQGLDNLIETRLGEGLKVLQPEEADTIIVAGMGGILIKQILEASPEILETAKVLILQPMNAQEVVRRWLLEHGFKIIDENLVREERHIYEIIVAVHGQQKVGDELELEISPILLNKREPLLEPFIQDKIQRIEKIMEQLEGKEVASVVKRRKYCQWKLKAYEEVYHWIAQWEK